MTTHTLIAASPPDLDLDARLALRLADMTIRLDRAAVEFEVRTAHLPGADPIPAITEIVPPVRLAPTAAPCPYTTPIAGLLYRARVHIETHGWLRGGLREDNGTARCPIGAIRIEASSRWQADDACALLLEVIEQDFADAVSIPSWNDQQASAGPVLHYLNRAAGIAHSRGI